MKSKKKNPKTSNCLGLRGFNTTVFFFFLINSALRQLVLLGLRAELNMRWPGVYFSSVLSRCVDIRSGFSVLSDMSDMSPLGMAGPGGSHANAGAVVPKSANKRPAT